MRRRENEREEHSHKKARHSGASDLSSNENFQVFLVGTISPYNSIAYKNLRHNFLLLNDFEQTFESPVRIKEKLHCLCSRLINQLSQILALLIFCSKI